MSKDNSRDDEKLVRDFNEKLIDDCINSFSFLIEMEKLKNTVFVQRTQINQTINMAWSAEKTEKIINETLKLKIKENSKK